LVDGVDRAIDPIGLHDYLSLNYVPGPHTIFAAVRKLLPGHMLTFEARQQKVTISQFWDLPAVQDTSAPLRRTGDLEQDLLRLLRQVVRDQLISDVPVGAFLSGGIDSSMVVALMSEVSREPVKTFSVGFLEQSFDELPYARIIAKRFGTDHHELVMQPQARETVVAMADYFDEPFADSSAVAVFAVSRLAAGHVKVALSGDGGDEVFGGYSTYQADKLAALYRHLPGVIGNRLIPTLIGLLPASDRKVSLDFKLKRFVNGGSLQPLPAHFSWKAFLSEAMKARLYNPDFERQHRSVLRPSIELVEPYYDRYRAHDLLNRLLYVDMKVQLVDDMLTKVDRMSMANSLEVRVPLLDLRLVEFMARLPSALKVHRLTLKYLLKRVAAKLLPREILRRRKAGFHVPVARWIKTELRDMVSDYLAPARIASHGIFNAHVVGEMLEMHWRGRHDYSRSIWNLLMFNLWHERYGKISAADTGQAALPGVVC
jgi:asparagine synthase (glutamine-hydrolysing)